jgi:heterodisulfide reductase subunit B
MSGLEMELTYYPGCSLRSMARDYGASIGIVCRRLGIALREMPGWSCCGASAAHNLDHELAVGLCARNLVLARDGNSRKIATACAGCFNRLMTAIHELNRDKDLRERIENKLGTALGGFPEVNHLLQIFADEAVSRRVIAETKRPLAGIRVACYYGCMLTRPAAVMKFDDPEQPRSMDLLLEKLGAVPVQWSHKAECCGGSLSASAPDIIVELGGEVLESARLAGADCIVVACPMCQANLDIRQKEMEKNRGVPYRLPIVYFTQLMGLAFGCPPRRLGLYMMLTDPRDLLRKLAG